MKKGFLIFVGCLLGTFLSFSQNINWLWTDTVAGGFSNQGANVALDKAGNPYVTGYLIGSPDYFGNASLDSSSFFVAKYTSAGLLTWVKGQEAHTYAVVMSTSIAVDDDNNVLVTGTYSGDSVGFGNVMLYNAFNQSNKIFIVKYDSTGNVLWSRSTAGNSNDQSNSIAVDKDGNVYITGSFGSGYNGFNSITFGNITLQKQGSYPEQNFFIAKYDVSGNIVWAHSVGDVNNSTVEGENIACDNNGNLYVSGNYSGPSVMFGGYMLYGNGGVGNIFLVKYDQLGNVLWAHQPHGGSGYQKGLSVDEKGNVFMSGDWVGNPVIFGQDTMFTGPPPQGYSTAYAKFFIAKYDSSGNVLWAKHANDDVGSSGYCIANDGKGHVFVAGGTPGRFGIDSFYWASVYDSTYVGPNDYYGVFILVIDEAGNLLGTKILEDAYAQTMGICADQYGNRYFASTYPLRISGTNEGRYFLSGFSCNLPSGIETTPSSIYTLQLHPNPLTTQATVQYSLPSGSKNVSLIIYDMLGRQQSRYRLNNTDSEISISANNLSSGVYLYSLVVDDRVMVSKKMIVE